MQRPIAEFFRPVGKGPPKPLDKRERVDRNGQNAAAGEQTPAAAMAADAAEGAAAAGSGPEFGVQQYARKRKRASRGASPPAGAAAQAEAGACPGADPAVQSKQQQQRQLTQLYLDVGQRHFHSYRCPTCGMLYARGTEADERLHAAFHASASKGPRYQGWQGERVVQLDGSRGRVLLFSSADMQGRGRKQLQELCTFLEEQMGLPRGWLLRVPLTLLLYVSAATKRIQALVAAEAIKEAYHVKPGLPAGVTPSMLSAGSAALPAPSASGERQAAGAGPAAAAPAPAAAQAGSLPAAAVAQVATSGRSLLSVTLSSGGVAADTAGVGAGGRKGGAAQAGSPTPAAAGQQVGDPPPQQQQNGQQQQQQQQLQQEVLQQQAQQQAQQPQTQQPTQHMQQQAPAPPPLALDRRARVRAVCGVRLLWVSLEARRRGLATRLLDCCRAQATPGYVVPRHELAFSAPTDDGRGFIEAYTGTRRFLVYE